MSALLVTRLHAAAEICERDEKAFRRDSERRLQGLTQLRIAAYRRYYLLKGMAATAASREVPAEAASAALEFALAETGWSEDDASYGEVSERLAETAAALQAARAAEGTADEESLADVAVRAMSRFEAWYRDRFGNAFLDLLETERGFLPVVDF
jgi:multidrug efflux pump subunit AcrA (membrane-fusion protein)